MGTSLSRITRGLRLKGLSYVRQDVGSCPTICWRGSGWYCLEAIGKNDPPAFVKRWYLLLWLRRALCTPSGYRQTPHRRCTATEGCCRMWARVQWRDWNPEPPSDGDWFPSKNRVVFPLTNFDSYLTLAVPRTGWWFKKKWDDVPCCYQVTLFVVTEAQPAGFLSWGSIAGLIFQHTMFDVTGG